MLELVSASLPTFRERDNRFALVAKRRMRPGRRAATLVFKCPFLKKNPDGTSLCRIYESRPKSCRLFPIEQRDIREVKATCSYYFLEAFKTGKS